MSPFSSGGIDLLGGAGGLVELKAALLASRGFAALVFAYFAYAGRTSRESPSSKHGLLRGGS